MNLYNKILLNKVARCVILTLIGGMFMSDSRAIGVFDSGVGGLTVLKELIKILPNENFIYFGDTKRVPYGTKPIETLMRYAREDEAFLLSKNVKMVVAACATVSSVAYSTGEELPVPFLGVVKDSVCTAVNATKNGKIGVIATPQTVLSGSHKKGILEFNKNAEVFSVPAPDFVKFVEAGRTDINDTELYNTAKEYLLPLKEKGIDTLILGCTHFPVLSEVITEILGNEVKLVNMGESTAVAAKNILTSNNLLNKEKGGNVEFYVSNLTNSFCNSATVLLGKTINNIFLVDLGEI